MGTKYNINLYFLTYGNIRCFPLTYGSKYRDNYHMGHFNSEILPYNNTYGNVIK